MSTTIRNKGVSHSDILHIPDELNLSNLTPSHGNIVTIENTKSLRIPRHPASGGSVDTRGENGQMRFNTISNIFEFYRNSNWTTLNYDSIGDRANTTFVSDTFPVPSNTFQFYGYNDGYGNKNFSSLTDLYSDASFQLFGGATLATTTGIYTDGTTSVWAAFPKEITNFGSNDFTISWWMTLDDLTSNSQILSLSYDADNGILIQYQYSSGNIQLVDKRDNSTTQSSQTLTQGTLYNYVLVREGLNFKLYLDRTEIIHHTTSAGYTFPDMYANYGTADYNTDNDNFVSFGASAPLGNTSSYTTSKIFRVDIWNKAINTQANIDNIYYNGYIYPFYSGMKMVVNNNMGVYIKPTDYTVQYINYNKGYVGIGNPDPQCMLDVSGSIGLHSLTIDDPDFEGGAKLYYKRGSGLALEISGNQYWSRTLLDSSATVFSTGSNADSLGHRIQTNFDNNMSFSNNSYDAPVPTAVNTVGPIVKIKDNAIVGKSFVDVESSAPSNALIIENALELNNSDVKRYFKDAIAGYFFEVDGGVGSIQDVVRGSGHAACDVSHNVYDETKLTNYGFDLSGADVSSFMSIPDMKIPSNGEFSICVRYFKSSNAAGEDIYNAGIQSIYTSSEQIGTLNIRTDSSDHTKLFIQFGGFKNDGYVNFTTSTGVLATNTWHFIVVNIKPHLSPEIYVNGIFKAVTTSLTNNDAIDGVTPDYPGNYGNLMLTPQKAYDNTSNNVSGTIDGVNIGTVRPYSYTFGVGSTSGNDERKYYSTYMVFGRTLTSDDATFWTTALDGYEYCLGDLIKPHRGDKFNARNRVYIDNSYVLHSEDASFQTHASTRGDVKANRLVAGNVTLEHGKAIIATPSTTNGLISAYYFQKYGAKGSIEDEVRGNGNEIKDRLNLSYDSKTYLGTYGINHALTATPDSYTGTEETDVTIVNSYCSVPSMQLPDTGVFTLQFRYYVKHDNDANSANNEFWRATITGEGNNSRVTNSGTLSLIRKGGGIGNSNPDYEGWTLYAHDNDGGGKTFQINGNWKGYEVAQWNTLTLVIKPYSTPIIYLNGVFAPFTDATRYNIINSDWSGENIEPVQGTPTGIYIHNQYITFGGYNGGTGGDTNFKQSTQQFQGYIGSYQVFNYALSPDDISYWFYALNCQGASKPKTLSVGKSYIYNSNADNNFGNGSGQTWKDWRFWNSNSDKGGINSYTFTSDRRIQMLHNQASRICLFNPGNYTNYIYTSDLLANDDDGVGIAFSYSQNNNFNNDGNTYNGFSFGFKDEVNTVFAHKYVNGTETELFTETDTRVTKTDFHNFKVIVNDNIIEFYITFNLTTEVLFHTHIDTDNIINQGTHFGVKDYEFTDMDEDNGNNGGAGLGTISGWKNIKLHRGGDPDRDHGINYDAKFDYVTKYNKSLQHISASDSMKMVISNQINMSHGNTLIYKQDQATRFGIKQSSNTDIDIALNPDVTMEVAHTFHTPNDFLFGGNDLSMTMHYLNTNSVNAVNNEIYNSANDANFGNGYSGQTWKDWRESGSSGSVAYTLDSTNKTIKMTGNKHARHCLFNPGNYTNYVYSVDIKPVDNDAVGIVISMSQPNNFNSSNNAAYSKWTGFVFILNGSTGSGTWWIYKNIDNIEYEEIVGSDPPEFINNFITIASGTASEWSQTKYHRFKAIAINNTIKFYITYDIDRTGTSPTETLLYTHYDTDNIILQGNHFGVYNRYTQNAIYKNIVLTELEFTDEITLQGIDNTIRIASNTISSDGDLRFIGDLNITGNLTLPHTIIENIKYKSSTHIKNIQTVNQIAEHVVIKPGNTSTASAVEIINTNSSKQFMTLNSGDSSDTNEKVRFNKSGVGIGTTNAENYALNVVGGNANCYGVYPIGSIIIFGGTNGQTNVPSGWLLCDGTLYDADDYPMLADIIGITYGGTAGTNFNVPDLSTRSGVGSADVDGINIAIDENVSVDSSKTGGNQTLNASQLVSHSHTVDVNYDSSNWNNDIVKGTSGTSHIGGNDSSFNKYFPFTHNGGVVERHAFNKDHTGAYHFSGKNNAVNALREVVVIPTANGSNGSLWLNGLGIQPFLPGGSTSRNGHILKNTIEKAHENTEVKYYYDVNSTRNISNVPNTIANSGNSVDYYPPSTLVRYIIYSGVHNTTTYPWI